ncbi:unnamed protein product [Rotaria magnacalcarata]|uniref:K Homology domain-containing protein n=1 Tax=Rotaria magnacalcarata TaxID=392030 RepID=A0A8S2MP06_9BILA|nr:unnamed protein product [Rotaria magnacalcarata]
MQNNPVSFQDAIARAQQVAAKLAAAAPNSNRSPSSKRPYGEEDSVQKRPAFTSPTQSGSIPEPVLRAQQIAQQINSQLGVKPINGSPTTPLSNQLSFQEDYKIPDKFVGLIIGKGGEQIVRLQAESGCKVQICQLRPEPIPNGPNPPDRLANLSGSRDAIERAKRIMDDIITRGKMTDSSTGSFNPYSMGGTTAKSIDVMLPSSKCGLVIGKGGENIKRVSNLVLKCGESIKEINRKSGAFVELDKNHSALMGQSANRVFKLRGTPEQILTAQQLMYDKVVNSPGGPGDMLSPFEFQQRHNLPLVGANTIDTWSNNNDAYGNGNNSNDPYSQLASTYGQWPQFNSYDQSSLQNNNNAPAVAAAAATGAPDMGQMDPAWLAYYQSMNYYSMMQAGMAGSTSSGTSTSTTATKPADSTANTTNATSTTPAINPTTGQPDYSQQWIEYYRSIGQGEYADEIARQMKASGSTSTSTSASSATSAAQATAMMMSSANPWAAYAQQWANAATSNTTNGTNSSTTSS